MCFVQDAGEIFLKPQIEIYFSGFYGETDEDLKGVEAFF